MPSRVIAWNRISLSEGEGKLGPFHDVPKHRYHKNNLHKLTVRRYRTSTLISPLNAFWNFSHSSPHTVYLHAIFLFFYPSFYVPLHSYLSVGKRLSFSLRVIRFRPRDPPLSSTRSEILREDQRRRVFAVEILLVQYTVNNIPATWAPAVAVADAF